MKDDLPVIPTLRQGEMSAVGTDGQILVVHIGGIGGEDVVNVRVYGDAEAFHLPVGGDVDVAPMVVHIAWLVEVHRTLRRFGAPFETPYAIEGMDEWGIELITGKGLGLSRVRDECRSRLLYALIDQLRVFPEVGLRLDRRSKE